MTQVEMNQQLLYQNFEVQCIVVEERTWKQRLEDRVQLILKQTKLEVAKGHRQT